MCLSGQEGGGCCLCHSLSLQYLIHGGQIEDDRRERERARERARERQSERERETERLRTTELLLQGPSSNFAQEVHYMSKRDLL